MEGILFPRGVVEGLEGLDAYRARGGYEAVSRLGELSPGTSSPRWRPRAFAAGAAPDSPPAGSLP